MPKSFTSSGYGPQCFGTSPKKTMADIETPDYPAPGTHKDIRFNKTNPPSWKFGNAKQRNGFLEQYTSKYPAPDQYKTNPETKKNQPPHTFYKAYPPAQQIDVESRYNYKPQNSFVLPHYPQFSFGYSKETDYTSEVPSPNTYSPIKSKKQSFNKQFDINKRTQNSFTRMLRPNPYGEEATFAGVGEFNVTSNVQTPYTKFGSGQRPPNIHPLYSSEIHYEIAGEMKIHGLGKTMGPKYPIIPADGIDFPASNHYNPTLLNHKQNIINFDSIRSAMHNVPIVKYPSPDKYANHSQVTKKRAVSFAKSQRVQKYADNPAPGTYQIKPVFNKSLGHMAKKLVALTQMVYPSSFEYRPDDHLTKLTPQRPINQYSNRIDFSRSTTGKVGPGDYLRQGEFDKAQLGKMSMSLKLKTRDNKYPAPGQYQIPGFFGKLPKYYCQKRKLDSNGNVLNGINRRSLSLNNQKRQQKQHFREKINEQAVQQERQILN